MKKIRINLLFIIFIAICSLSIFFFNYGHDFYWHIKAGEYIVLNRKIPFIDVFSWYGASHNLHWISHEWLFEIIIYLFGLISPQYGPIIYVIITMLILSNLLYKLGNEQFNKFPFYTIIWGLFAIAFLAGTMQPRPHLISYCLFGLTLYILKQILNNHNSKIFYITPLITILWANIHGGSSNLAYTIYLIVLICSFIPLKNKTNLTNKQYKKLLYCLTTSFFFIIINPHTYKMIIYPYQNMGYSNMINCISEWQTLSVLKINNIFYLTFIGIVLINIIKKAKLLSLMDILLLSSFVFLGFKSIKLLPFLYIIATFIIPKYWTNNKFKINERIILIFILLSIIFMAKFIYKPNTFKIVDDSMISYINKNKDKTLYNSYDLGGYLIYKDIKVFIDGRADMYIDTIFCDACDIETGKSFKSLDKYNFDIFIITNNDPLNNYLRKNNNYTLILTDNKNSLFIKKEKGK